MFKIYEYYCPRCYQTFTRYQRDERLYLCCPYCHYTKTNRRLIGEKEPKSYRRRQSRFVRKIKSALKSDKPEPVWIGE